MPIKLTSAELVEQVKAHAVKNYEKGWDTMVECWSDADILAQIGQTTSLRGALAKLRPIVGVWQDRQADAAYHRREAGIE